MDRIRTFQEIHLVCLGNMQLFNVYELKMQWERQIGSNFKPNVRFTDILYMLNILLQVLNNDDVIVKKIQ